MRTIVPAPEGCSLLTYRNDDYPADYSKVPVIAWAIDLEPGVTAPGGWWVCVTPISGKGEPGNDWAVLHPDGTVTTVTGPWMNLDHWLECRRSVTERKEKKAALAA